MSVFAWNKPKTIDFRSFMKNEHIKKTTPYAFVATGVGIFIMIAPEVATAQTKSDASFGRAYDAWMNVLDWICVGVITFAGATWMLGNRSKGIEFLICASCGFVLARHAVDIKNFLKGI